MNVGTLTIEIATNVARLQADMDATKRAVSGAMKDVETYVGYAKTAFVALAGIGSVASFAGMISSSIEARAKLYDLSLMSGITVEALASLGKVAKYSDTSLQEIAAGSNKLQKALATSNEDSKGAAQAIQALGLSFDKFKAQAPDQQMLAVAKALGQFEDGAGKSVVAMLLFGKAGASLLPFLKELEERGLANTKMTTASALAAKEYEDNLVSLKNASDEWKKQLVNDLLPALVSITNQLVAGRNAYGGWLAALRDLGTLNPLNSLGENIAGSMQKLDALQAQLTKLKNGGKEPGFTGAFASGNADKALIPAIEQDIKTIENRLTYLRQIQAQEALATGSGVQDERRFQVRKAKLDVTAPGAAGAAAADTFTPFMNGINTRIAQYEAEYAAERKLTEGEKARVDGMEKLSSGAVKASEADKAWARYKLDLMVQTEKLAKDEEAEARWQEESRKQTEHFIEVQAQRLAGLQDTSNALALQAEEYGLNARELEALNSSRLRESAAALRARQLMDEASPDIAKLNELYRRQADELERIAAARDRSAARQAADEADPAVGAGRAVKDYLDEVRRAGDATQQAVGNAMHGLEDQMVNLFTGKKVDMKSWVDQILVEVVRLRVVKPMLAEIFGGAQSGGWFKQLIGIFGGSSAGTNIGGEGFGGAFASGGYLAPGKWGIAGENGPEPIFGGQTGLTVQAAGKGGGVTLSPVINLHIDARSDVAQVQGLVREGVTQGQRQMLEELKASGRI